MISTDNTHSQLHIKQARSNAEKTLPEAQPTQSIESVPRINSTAYFHLNLRDNSRYGVNTLGPLCLWKCFFNFFSTVSQFVSSIFSIFFSHVFFFFQHKKILTSFNFFSLFSTFHLFYNVFQRFF